MRLGGISPGGLVLAGALWAAAIGVGLWRVAAYEWTPGAEAEPPARWPAEAGPVADRPTLLLFAHARCPCTRASLEELAAIAARAGARLEVRIVLWDPLAPGGGAPGELAAKAAEVPGARLIADDGAASALFRVRTSGHVLLYDEGRLVHSGGITAGRGRVGPSRGRRLIEAHLARTTPRGAPPTTGPVYGCALGACDGPR